MLLVPVVGGVIVGLMARFGQRQDSRPRHSRGDRGDPAERREGAAQHCIAEADLGGDRHRLGRPVRRGRADHHDRRRIRLAGCAMDAPDRRRTHNAAGGRRSSRHVGDVCRAACVDPAWPWSCCSSSGGRAALSRLHSPASRRRLCASAGSAPARCSRCPTCHTEQSAPVAMWGACVGAVGGLCGGRAQPDDVRL